MRVGAVDFVETPFSEQEILAAVDRALELGRQKQKAGAEAAEGEARLSQLSAREHQVMHLRVGGGQNKSIVYELGISPRTVEIHRARIMQKNPGAQPLRAGSMGNCQRHRLRLRLTACALASPGEVQMSLTLRWINPGEASVV
jgi:DNA-binding CsgD family transcriptional regulator